MRRQLALGIVIGSLVLLVLEAVVTRSNLGPGVVPKLTGSSLWITSRTAGVSAFLALSLDVAFGLFISTGVADRAIPRARIVEVHRFLSAVTLAFTALHTGALLGDRFVRFDILDVLVPFVSRYRPLSVALGLLAAYLALVIHQSFAWRRRLGAKLWRSLHYASFAAYAAALLHGVFAGTDARALSGVYLASGSLIGFLVLYRVAIARRPQASGRGWRQSGPPQLFANRPTSVRTLEHSARGHTESPAPAAIPRDSAASRARHVEAYAESPAGESEFVADDDSLAWEAQGWDEFRAKG